MSVDKYLKLLMGTIVSIATGWIFFSEKPHFIDTYSFGTNPLLTLLSKLSTLLSDLQNHNAH